jgi:phosphatidylglycerophosphate synthase
MVSRWIRIWYSMMLRPVLLFLARIGVTPDLLTVSSLILMIVAGFVLSQHQPVPGGIFLLLGGILDGMDGELARVMGRATKFGAFLDSICDHAGDFAVYCGLFWWFLHNGGLTEVTLIFIALFGSLFGSQVRSRAGMVGIDLKDIGLFTRFERISLLIIGLFTPLLLVMLWILAVLNTLSALQRVIYALYTARREPVYREK